MGTPRTIGIAERRARLAIRHRLLPSRRVDDVVAITDDLVALHSSDPATVYLSLAARMAHPSLAAVDAALYDDRTLVRHHAMRRTLWVFGHEMARLAHVSSTLALVGPEERRLIKLLEAQGIADDGEAWLRDARRDIVAALDSLGTATARQLGDAVPTLNVPIAMAVGKSYEGKQSAHSRVLLLLGFEGLIARAKPTGTWINSQYRWTSMGSWLLAGLGELSQAEGAAVLVDRWLRAFGPATTADVQWWTGWTGSLTKPALASAGAQIVDLGGVDGWVAADDVDAVRSSEPWVALLPGLDPTTMGWKQRHWYLDQAVAPHVFDRNGNGGPAVWVDGQIVGGWVQRKDGRVVHRLFVDVGAERCREIDEAAGALEELLGPSRFTVRFPAPMQSSLLDQSP